MSVPDPGPPRKPRRLGLYLPFALALVLAAAWSGAWIWLRGQAAGRVDAAAEALRAAGWQVSWGERGIGGYPFRLDVTLKDLSIREPSGWALLIPRLETEAYAYNPGHWMMAAPDGLTLVRPIGGPVAVSGRLIRASLGSLAKRPPSFSFEGVGLGFRALPGAQPFALTAAERVEFHLRAGPDDEAGLFAKVDGGVPRPGSVLGLIAGAEPVAIVFNATFSRTSGFAGGDWPLAVGAWSFGGGAIHVREASLTAGGALARVRGARLHVGADGRVTGLLDTEVKQAPRIIDALARTGAIPAEAARMAQTAAPDGRAEGPMNHTLSFRSGETMLGPIPLGRAPRIYQPR